MAQVKWRKVHYDNLPHNFFSMGILSPNGRFFVGARYDYSNEYPKHSGLNWGILDLYTSEYKDNFRLRRDAVAYIETFGFRTLENAS